MISKENKLDKKQREKTFKATNDHHSPTKDLLSYIKKTLSQNKAVDITEIQVDQNFSELYGEERINIPTEDELSEILNEDPINSLT